MEYKLKKSEFYRIAYLLSGIFMFLFLFGIFSLSSHAQQGSFHGWYAQENVQNESYISFLQNFDSSDFVGLNNPAFDYDYSFTILHHAIDSNHTASNVSVNYIMHVVTSYGDMIVGTFLCPSLSDGASRTFTSSGTSFGIPSYAYIEVISTTDWARIAGAVEVSSWSFNVTPNSSFSNNSDVNFSDYSSFSLINATNNVKFTSDFGGSSYPTGSAISYSIRNFNNIYAAFPLDSYVNYSDIGHQKYIFYFNYYTSVNPFDSSSCALYVVRDGVLSTFPNTDFVFVSQSVSNGIYCYSYYVIVDFGYDADISNYNFTFAIPANLVGLDFSLLKYKATVSDYMGYAQSQWNAVSTEVTSTNANTADSVSTVGTASTYESAQFTNFDNLVTQTGVDTFSLSTVSTPLLWVGGLITSCYNALPSSIQYLLMFVGVFGLICMILNVFGRVTSRIGETDPTKLNKHDVFSKIEKNGSI